MVIGCSITNPHTKHNTNFCCRANQAVPLQRSLVQGTGEIIFFGPRAFSDELEKSQVFVCKHLVDCYLEAACCIEIGTVWVPFGTSTLAVRWRADLSFSSLTFSSVKWDRCELFVSLQKQKEDEKLDGIFCAFWKRSDKIELIHFFSCAKLQCCLLAFPCVLCASRPGSLETVRTLVSLARVLVLSVGLRLLSKPSLVGKNSSLDFHLFSCFKW